MVRRSGGGGVGVGCGVAVGVKRKLQAARNTTDSRNISRRPDFIAPVLPSLNAVSPRASFPTFNRSSSPLNALSGIEARQARPIHRINLAIKITKWDDPVPLP